MKLTDLIIDDLACCIHNDCDQCRYNYDNMCHRADMLKTTLSIIVKMNRDMEALKQSDSWYCKELEKRLEEVYNLTQKLKGSEVQDNER